MQSSLFNNEQNLLPIEGDAVFYPHFFSKVLSDQYFELLKNEVNWKQEPIKMFGKLIMQPRLTAWYGDVDKSYSYSGITMNPQHWTPTLLAIKQSIETVSKVNFTSALLNFYRDGRDSMGWHRDNEKELGINPVIGSVSFGCTRNFQLRNYKQKKIVTSIALNHGSYLLMKGTTQHNWEHQIPKTTKILDGRINITFRVLI